MKDMVAVVVWPDGTYILYEDFQEEEWYFKSDDYTIKYLTEEEYMEFIGENTHIDELFDEAG